MNSSDDDETNSTKTDILNSTDTRTGTQVLDFDSPPTSPEINSTIPFEEVTQVVEDIIPGEIVKTQMVDSDGEGTDRTELLSENENATDDDCELVTPVVDDSVSGGGKKTSLSTESHGTGSAHRSFMSVRVASLRASGLAAAGKMNPTGKGSETRSLQGDNQSEKEIVCKDDEVIVARNAASGDMEGREDTKANGTLKGRAPKNFMSVRAASVCTAALASEHKRTHAGIHSEAKSVHDNNLSAKKVVHKDNELSGIRNPATDGIQGTEKDKDRGTLNCNVTTERSNDVNESRVARSTVRRLFTEDAADNDSSLPEFDANDHEFAGLTYVKSQEPGELSQANALNIVDQLISVNNEEFLSETNWGSAIKKSSPPVSNSKGAQMLAQKIKPRSPVREAGIYDWDDSHEDEGGGCFFIKRKEELLGGSCRVQRSYNQLKKSRLENSNKGRGILDKVDKKEEESKLHQKMMALAQSDSRLMVYNSKKNENIQRAPKTRSRKDICKEFDAQVNSSTFKKQLAETGTNEEPLNIGGPTKVPSLVKDRRVSAANDNDSRIRKKARTEKVSLQRRTSDSVLRKSKRLKILDSNSSGEMSQKNAAGQNLKSAHPTTKGKDKKVNDRNHLHTGTAANEKIISERRSVKSIDKDSTVIVLALTGQELGVSAMNKTHIYEANRCQGPAPSNENSSFSKGQMEENHNMVTPIARRTRKSLFVKPSNISELSFDGNGGTTVDEVRDKKRRRRNIGVDAPKPSTVADQSESIRKDESTQPEPSDIGSHEKLAKTSHEKRDTHKYSHRKRTHPDVSNDIEEVVNADAPSTVQEIEYTQQPLGKQKKLKADVASTVSGIEAKDQSLTRQKRLEVDGRNNSVPMNQKRLTRSSVHCKALLSSEKNSEGSATGQSVLEQDLTEAADNRLNVSPSEKVNAQAFTRRKKIKVDVDIGVKLDPKRKTRSSVHRSTARSSEKNPNESLERQLLREPGLAEIASKGSVMKEKLVLKDNYGDTSSKCVAEKSGKDTLSPSTTHMDEASPVIVGNGYLKKSTKKNLPRSPLSPELKRLEANEVIHSPSKDLRKRKDMANVRVLFSHHLDGDMIRQQKKTLVRIGASIASSSSEATHFVTDKFVRTRNMLEAIASGKPVVTHLWLDSCGQANCFIDEKNYILRDLKKEKEIGFSMPVSLVRARQSPLLESKKVYITPNVKPSEEIIASLVKAVHGQTVERLGRSATKDKVPDDLLVLSCEEDYAMCMPLLEKGAMVYGSELLLNGIVIQKLEYGRHRLFSDYNRKKTRSTPWLRKT